MLLLHAIAPAEAALQPRVGLRGAPLRLVEAAQLVAVATEFEPVPTDFGRADVLANHDLLMRLGDCLPVRFPTWFEDEAGLCAHVRSHAPALLESLRRLRGRCELAVTAVWTPAATDVDEPPSVATPGALYLLERRRRLAGSEQRRKRALELRDALQQVAQGTAEAERHRVAPSESVALSSAMLIPRAEAVEFRARLLEAVGTRQDVRILVNGPWPPYTFAGG